MMTTAAYPATMTELRGEPAHSSMWSNYGGSATHVGSRLVDSPFHSSSAARPRSGGMDHEAQNYTYGSSSSSSTSGGGGASSRGGGAAAPGPGAGSSGYAQDEYERHGSYSSLKRSFSQSEPPAYQEMVQDMREDASRLTVNQDHKLLAFRRTQDRTTLVDAQGRVQQLDLSAQLHGMFFLSEIPATNAVDGTMVQQPELTCYRRNLFQISGSLLLPRGQLSFVNEQHETLPVTSMEVAISAIESVDGNPVRLIVIPWKTPPPNSPDISQTPDQEPPTLPLIPFQDDGSDSEGELAMYPIGWRRLQFRIATANNGRRKELQQHFVLHLKLHGTLADNSKVTMAEATTAPIVVRGRSPRNFQARKEIPLLGSSAGSRGQALVETGLGVVASASTLRQDKSRSLDMQVPRSSFTFSPPKPPGSTLGSLRSNSFPSWGPPPTASPYPSTSLGSDSSSYPKLPLAGGPAFANEPQELQPLPQSSSLGPSMPLPISSNDGPLRSHYSYTSTGHAAHQDNASMSMPRYVDSNPRPSKSPRQSGHQSVHSGGSVGDSAGTASSSDYRYGSTGASSYRGSESAYPPSSSWATTSSDHSSTSAYAAADARSYSFSSHEPYRAGGTVPPLKHEPNSSVYSGGPRGSFDSINNYSWSAA